MKIKFTKLWIALLLTSELFSQEIQKPNYEQIKLEISDKSSSFYYPKLVEKIIKLDTTMTTEEYRNLYYGFIFNDDYKPYANTSQYDELLEISNSDKELTKKDYTKYISLAEKSLIEFPIDLRLMNMLAYVYSLDGQKEKSDRLSSIFQSLLRTIISSGDGTTCETSFHVISVSHEYVLLMMFEMDYVSQSLTGNCDYLELKKNKYTIDGLYFNISKLQERNLELLKNK